MISKKFIIDTINTEYSKWCKTHSKPPAIALTDIVIKKMRPFGKVDNRGVLYINSSYIGTDMYADVIDTIKHELAHLIVGFQYDHGPVWKACCIEIGCEPSATRRLTNTTYIQNNYNYTLMAEFADGSTLRIKECMRRSTKYSNAKPNQYKVKGKAVSKFYYVALKD